MLLFTRETCPPAAVPFLEDFAATAGRPDFPCMFAPKAFADGELLFGHAEITDGCLEPITAVMDAAACAIARHQEQVVVVWVSGLAAESLAQEVVAAERIMEHLLAADRSGWPAAVPVDPRDPGWNFWYAGVDFFINFSTPHHLDRRSRNLGRCFTMVLQSQSSFDRFPRQAKAMREKIRRRIGDYDALGPSPALGVHGEAPEIDQFFLGETNTCPVRLLEPTTAGRRGTMEGSSSTR